MRVIVPVLVILLPPLLGGIWLVHEVRLYRREEAWRRRRQQVDALRVALYRRAAERDREAAEREAFDRKLKEEEDGDA